MLRELDVGDLFREGIGELSCVLSCQPKIEMSGCFDRPSTQGGAKPRLEGSVEDRSGRRNRRVRGFPNRSIPFLPPISNPWTRERFVVSSALICLNRSQHGAKPFIGHDVSR
jgi:hypothetical protein